VPVVRAWTSCCHHAVHEALLLRPARSDPPDPPSHFVKEERGCRKERNFFFPSTFLSWKENKIFFFTKSALRGVRRMMVKHQSSKGEREVEEDEDGGTDRKKKK
jgi:hypothetical protein